MSTMEMGAAAAAADAAEAVSNNSTWAEIVCQVFVAIIAFGAGVALTNFWDQKQKEAASRRDRNAALVTSAGVGGSSAPVAAPDEGGGGGRVQASSNGLAKSSSVERPPTDIIIPNLGAVQGGSLSTVDSKCVGSPPSSVQDKSNVPGAKKWRQDQAHASLPNEKLNGPPVARASNMTNYPAEESDGGSLPTRHKSNSQFGKRKATDEITEENEEGMSVPKKKAKETLQGQEDSKNEDEDNKSDEEDSSDDESIPIAQLKQHMQQKKNKDDENMQQNDYADEVASVVSVDQEEHTQQIAATISRRRSFRGRIQLPQRQGGLTLEEEMESIALASKSRAKDTRSLSPVRPSAAARRQEDTDPQNDLETPSIKRKRGRPFGSKNKKNRVSVDSKMPASDPPKRKRGRPAKNQQTSRTPKNQEKKPAASPYTSNKRVHTSWETRFEQLEAYKEKHGHANPKTCNVDNDDDLRIGRWVSEQRHYNKIGKLAEWKRHKFLDIGCERFGEDNREEEEEEENDGDDGSSGDDESGSSGSQEELTQEMASKISAERSSRRSISMPQRGQLTLEEEMDAIVAASTGVTDAWEEWPDPDQDQQASEAEEEEEEEEQERPVKYRKGGRVDWNDRLLELQAFQKKFGHANPRLGKNLDSEYKHLAQWLANQRSNFQLGKRNFTTERLELLRDVGCDGFDEQDKRY